MDPLRIRLWLIVPRYNLEYMPASKRHALIFYLFPFFVVFSGHVRLHLPRSIDEMPYKSTG